jgi:hypothetical protein
MLSHHPPQAHRPLEKYHPLKTRDIRTRKIANCKIGALSERPNPIREAVQKQWGSWEA